MNAFKQLSITFPELVRAYASATSVFSLLAVVVLGIVIVFHCINFIGVILGKRPVNERDPRDENICLQFYCNIGLIFCWYHTSSSMQAKLPDADYNNMRGIEKYGQVTTQDSVQELGQIYLFSMMVSWVIVAFALNLFRLGLRSVLLQINEKWFHMNFQVEEDIEMQRPAAAPVPPEDSVEPHATPTSDANVVTPQPPHYDYIPCPIDNPPPY
ncbi:hypothetical protein FQN55_006054 [Onygenales sp. PD_40]|nr:hypothetical protein FQN55_006054 [Onygenales sp. PD_40]KAK2781548.1 hypothetical protein FQN52_001581 [Onygenales sp. PD_12]